MTRTYTFEGASDDTFGTRENYGADYDNCASGEPITFLLKGGGDSLLVTGQYCPGNATSWQIGIARADQDDERPLPPWPMSFVPAERPYTPALRIEAPDDTTIELVAA